MIKTLITRRLWQRLLLVALLLIMSSWLNRNEPSLAANNRSQTIIDGYLPYYYYIFSAGSSLHSADFTMRQDYQPGACISAVDASNQFFTLNLDLPDRTRIDYLRLFFYDTDAANSIANIRKYDGIGNYIEIASVSSGGNTGYGTTLSGFAEHVVNNSNGAYVLNWQPNITGTTMQLCGLRVAYRLPAIEIFLPMVENH